MPRSDNTCYGHRGRPRAVLARLSDRLHLSHKHKTYLHDLLAAGALAVLLWTLFAIGGLMQP